MRDDRERLLDIQQAVADISKYAQRGKGAFEEEELIQTWVVHHLQILGEAAAGISDSFKKEHSEIPWSKIVGMCNILVHHYFGVDVDVVWQVIEKDLPELDRNIKNLLEESKSR